MCYLYFFLLTRLTPSTQLYPTLYYVLIFHLSDVGIYLLLASLVIPFLRFGEVISGGAHFSLTPDALKKVLTGQASQEVLLSILHAVRTLIICLTYSMNIGEKPFVLFKNEKINLYCHPNFISVDFSVARVDYRSAIHISCTLRCISSLFQSSGSPI